MLLSEIYSSNTKADANLVVALTVDTDSYIDEVSCNSSLGGFELLMYN